MDKIQLILNILSLIISVATVCTLIYGFGRFLAKPHDTLEERVTLLEVKQQELERWMGNGKSRFEHQDGTNEVLIQSTLALIEFEIQYCLTEKKPISKDLEKARDDLHRFLARKL